MNAILAGTSRKKSIYILKNYSMGIERRSIKPSHTDKRREDKNETENTETAGTNPFYVEKLIGKGLCVLAGPPKTGKSWLVLWLAHCVSLGLPIWQFKRQKSEVLYVSLEDPRQRIQKRLAEVTGGDTG